MTRSSSCPAGSSKSGPDQCSQKCRRYSRTAPGWPSISWVAARAGGTAGTGTPARRPRWGSGRRCRAPGADHQRTDQVGTIRGEGLGDAAADVVARDHRPGQPQLPDERGHAAGLRRGAVLGGRVGRGLVGFAEPAQVRRDDLGIAGEQRHDLPVIAPATGPAVQQDHGGTTTGPVVSEAETIDRGDLAHAASIPSPENRFQWPAPAVTIKGCPTRRRCRAGTPAYGHQRRRHRDRPADRGNGPGAAAGARGHGPAGAVGTPLGTADRALAGHGHGPARPRLQRRHRAVPAEPGIRRRGRGRDESGGRRRPPGRRVRAQLRRALRAGRRRLRRPVPADRPVRAAGAADRPA